MQFTPYLNVFKEISLENGLIALESGQTDRLYSDGLESDEYITYTNNCFRYEDNCVIGHDVEDTLHTLLGLKWPLNHKFYIVNKH